MELFAALIVILFYVLIYSKIGKIVEAIDTSNDLLRKNNRMIEDIVRLQDHINDRLRKL